MHEKLFAEIRYLLYFLPGKEKHRFALDRLVSLLSKYEELRHGPPPRELIYPISIKRSYIAGETAKDVVTKSREELKKYSGAWRDLVLLVLDATDTSSDRASIRSLENEYFQIFWYQQLKGANVREAQASQKSFLNQIKEELEPIAAPFKERAKLIKEINKKENKKKITPKKLIEIFKEKSAK